MSDFLSRFRLSQPAALALAGVLMLVGIAVAATYPPVPAGGATQGAVTAAPLRIGVQALPGGAWAGDAPRCTDAGLEYALGERLAADLGRPVHYVQVDAAQRARALDEGSIDAFVGHFDARPVPAGVNVVSTGYRSGLSVAMRADAPVQAWQDLAARAGCVSTGNLQASRTAHRAPA